MEGLPDTITDAPARPLAPGRLSKLLADVARLSSADVETAWSRVPRPGEVLGRYELVREIGRGGFGIVFEALDRDLGRHVALKVVRPGAASRSALGSDGMLREADAAAQLNHPNIATLHDVGRWEGGAYLVFELLRGETLEDRLHRGKVPLREALWVALEISSALAYAHAAGVVHRDLKPANVFLTEDGRVKLLDFGLAHVVGGAPTPAAGTPAFMAPEQWRGEQGDARTDVFAAGVILHEMLTGELPYPVTGGRPAVLDVGPAPLLNVRAAPRLLVQVTREAIARDPGARPRDGRALEVALVEVERVLDRGPRRRRLLVVASVVAAFAAAIGRLVLPSHAPASRERTAVLIADAENETGERPLDSIAGLLAATLDRSRRVRVVARSRVFDLLAQSGRQDVSRLRLEVVHGIADRAGAAAVLAVTVRRFGAVYAIDVEAVEARSHERLFAIAERGEGIASVPSTVERVGARIREAFDERGDELAASSVSAQASAARDLDAYRHYFEGRDCLERPSRGRAWSELDCQVHFERAVAIDPEFALAHYELGRLSEFEYAPAAQRRAALERAMRGIDQLPRKERDLVLAWKAHLESQHDQAISIYRDVAARYPDDKNVPYLAGDVEFHRGHLADAVPWFERVLELDPEHEYALDHVVLALGLTEDRDGLRRLVTRLEAARPSPATLHALSNAKGWLGDASSALEVALRFAEHHRGASSRLEVARARAQAGKLAEVEAALREEPPAPGVGDPRYLLAAVLVQQGRGREAERVLDAASRDVRDEQELATHHIRRAHLLAGTGSAGAIAAEAERLARIAPEEAANLAVHLAYAGDLERAARLAAGLPRGSAVLALYEGLATWRGGDPGGAAARLASVASAVTSYDFGLPYDVPAYLLGEALFAAGRDAEAIEALRRFQRMYVGLGWWRAWTLPKSRIILARALARTGDVPLAIAQLDELLVERGRGEPTDPLAREARDLRVQLMDSGSSYAK